MLNRRAVLIPSFLVSVLVPAGRAQVFGTVSLDPSLAEAGAQVTGVLIKNLQGGGLGYCEGPSADAEGNVFFTEGNPSRIWKVTPSGQGSVFGGSSNFGSNGTEFDSQGRLIVGQHGAIAAYTKEGARSILQSVPGINVNDLSIGSNGGIYYSHWSVNVFFRAPDGQITTNPNFQTANGVEWIEERKKVYVAQDGPDEVWVYDAAPDGKLSNGKVFKAIAEPDGITADEKGNIYIASWKEGKVLVYDTTGKSLGSITVTGATGLSGGLGLSSGQDGNTSNVVFGGPDRTTLYITGDGGLYKVPMKVAGRQRPGTVRLNRAHTYEHKLRLSRSVFNPRFQTIVIGLPFNNQNGQLRIVDTKNREIWAAPIGIQSVEWNGRSANGQLLPFGQYFVLSELPHKPLSVATVRIAHD